MRRPSESPTPSASTEARRVCVTISTPRLASVRSAKRASPSGVWPRMRCAPSTSTQRGLTWARRGWWRSASSAISETSAIASTPEKPAPATTKVSRRVGGVRRGVGELDLAQDVVAQADGVAEVLEAEGVLAQAGHGRGAGDRAERDHELLVGDRDAARLGLDLDHAPLAIERHGAAEHEVGVGHMVRSGTTTWRGSMLPAAASGSSGV